MNNSIFQRMAQGDYEELIFCHDVASSLRAIIAIHDTTLGPAVGGIRRWVYEREQEAIEDALRLSRAMTYKLAASGCNAGGGKAVIMVNSQDESSEAMYRSLGRYVESLNGRFNAGPDVGTSIQALEYMRMETKYVSGFPDKSLGKTDASLQTARGVAQGIRACLNEVFGSRSASGRKISIQGLGEVGYNLVRELYQEVADIVVTDIDKGKVERAVNELGVKAIEPEDIYDINCDVFAPCAMGGILNGNTIPRLKCSIVAGSANNQLCEDRHGDMLHQRGILYAPDFVINAGAIVYDIDFVESGTFNRERAEVRVSKIYDNIAKVIEIAKRCRIPTYKAAMMMAEERINAIKKSKNIGHKVYGISGQKRGLKRAGW